MNRFNKSYELSVFLMLFVLVIEGIRGDKSNRIDAEKEPFETVILADDGGARSTLFGSCLAASRTLDAKIYSIELSNPTNEFIRYVPDSSQLTLAPEWTTVARDPPVTKITDCAEAAHRGGNPMFKYSGGDDCKVCNRSYDLKYQPDCEAKEQDAVFISTLAVVKCPLPARAMLRSKEKGTYFCVIVSTRPLDLLERNYFCGGIQADIYSGPVESARFDDLVKILKDMKVESSNFAVLAFPDPSNIWNWASSPAGPGGPVDPALMVSAPSTTPNYMIFMNGAAGFKLDFGPLQDMGVVCVSEFP